MSTLLQVMWDASPEIIRIGGLSLRWYGLFWALSFYIGYEVMFRIFKREGIPLKHVDKLLYIFAFGSIVGARLGHCFFYDFSYYIRNPFDIIKVWEGGLASHGGAIGIVTALYFFKTKGIKISNLIYQSKGCLD